jgi:hypothetical protein
MRQGKHPLGAECSPGPIQRLRYWRFNTFCSATCNEPYYEGSPFVSCSGSNGAWILYDPCGEWWGEESTDMALWYAWQKVPLIPVALHCIGNHVTRSSHVWWGQPLA